MWHLLRTNHVKVTVLITLRALSDWILKKTTQGRQVRCVCPFYRHRNWSFQKQVSQGLIQGQSGSMACVLLLIVEPHCIYESETKTQRKGNCPWKPSMIFHCSPLILPSPRLIWGGWEWTASVYSHCEKWSNSATCSWSMVRR